MIVYNIRIQSAWFDLAHNRDNFMAFVNMVMNLCHFIVFIVYQKR